MTDQDQPYIALCRNEIAEKIGWGNQQQWTHQDFLRLSEWIQEDTGTYLSHTTLKRVWGKVKYHSLPNTSTLDTLAKFAGYANWRTLVASKQQEEKVSEMVSVAPIATHESPSPIHTRDRLYIARAAAIVLLLLVAMTALLGTIFATYDASRLLRSYKSSDYLFTAETTSSGIPNTVLFQYDAETAGQGKVSIQSSSGVKSQVSSTAHQYTAQYYYPGVYQAQLLVDDTIVREEQVIIGTDGWQALIEQQPVPYYFQQASVRQGKLGIDNDIFSRCFPDADRNTPWTAYYNVGNFAIDSEDFLLETELKNTFGLGKGVCQDSSIVLLRKKGLPITIPLAIPGCLARVDEELKKGPLDREKIRLQAFGTDFSDWVQVRCESKDQQLRLWVNQQLAYEGPWQDENNTIVGIAYRFYGNGEVKSVKIGPTNQPPTFSNSFAG